MVASERGGNKATNVGIPHKVLDYWRQLKKYTGEKQLWPAEIVDGIDSDSLAVDGPTLRSKAILKIASLLLLGLRVRFQVGVHLRLAIFQKAKSRFRIPNSISAASDLDSRWHRRDAT